MTLYSNRGFQPSPDADRPDSLPDLAITLESTLGESAEYFLKLGNQHYNSFLSRSKRHDLDIAINCYRRALETNPDLSEGYVKLASALYDKGELAIPHAMDYCKKALAMNPANTEAREQRGPRPRAGGGRAPRSRGERRRAGGARLLLRRNRQLGHVKEVGQLPQLLRHLLTHLGEEA